MKSKKKVLLIARAVSEEARSKAGGFASRVQNSIGESVEIEHCEISELFFELSAYAINIYHSQKKFDLRDFDLVVIRHIGKMANEAQAIVQYCEYFGIRYTDEYLNRLMLDNKMSTQFLLWFNGIKNWPHTFYGDIDEMIRRFPEFGGKAIMKDNEGSKGRSNFLVESVAEISDIQKQYPDKRFVLQEFIPNSGDLRVLVFNGKPVLVIERKGVDGSHLNNTSQGGVAQVVPIESVSPEVIDVCVKAASIARLQVAGVDVMFDSTNNKSYLLEVNNAPQVSSGAFQDEKVRKYSEMLLEMVGIDVG